MVQGTFSRVVMMHHGLAAGRCPGTTATDTVGKRQMLQVSGVAPLVIATKDYSLGVYLGSLEDVVQSRGIGC